MSKPMKRTATSEINRDNWDQDDEPEEVGTFKPVGADVLSKRDIKVARRRLSKASEEKPLFSNFSGFGNNLNSSTPDIKTSFNFLSKLNGSSSHPTTETSQSISSTKENNDETPKSSNESGYLESIETLNKCLLEWLEKCVKKNPACILTPIFRDYEKYLESLNKPVAEKTEETKPVEPTSNFKFNFASNVSSQNTFSSSENTISNTSPLRTTPSSAGTKSLISSSSWMPSTTMNNPSIFSSLTSTNSSIQPSPMFGSFNNPLLQPSGSSDSAKQDDDEDSPPVNDFKPVTEDDALFSQRVKLFIQKDKQYTDRGVGTLYIKEAKDGKGNKIHQAIIRADTSIGNIIFNIRITSDIPTKRMGKNNVMLVCLPLPDHDAKSKPDDKSKPVPVLLRVKTAEEADQLLEEIEKYK